MLIHCYHGYSSEIVSGGRLGPHHSGAPVKPYQFWRDPLWWAGCGLYVLNRWWLKVHIHSAFLHGYFDDVLLIPCALPPVLWFQELLRLRRVGPPPGANEIAFHLAVWSVLFEVIGPHIMKTTGDPLDVVAYVAGGLAAGCWWRRRRVTSLAGT